MNEVEMMSPSKVAEQYGGDKRKIAQATRMGILDPTVAVMAGMFIDRVRGAAAAEQAPQQTVAQQVLTPQQPQMPPQMATQQMPPQGLPAAAAAPVDRGLAALPVNESMVPGGPGYAGGGIIAFDDGGHVPRYDGEDESLVDLSDPDNLMALENQRWSQLPQGDVVAGAPTSLEDYINRATAAAARRREIPMTEAELAIQERYKAAPERAKQAKEDAVNKFLMDMGFRMAGSKSPRFLQAAGEAGTGASPTLFAGAKEARDIEESGMRGLAEMGKTQRAEKLAAISAGEKLGEGELSRASREKIAKMNRDSMERIAREKETDFQRKWGLYVQDAKDRGVKPTIQEFHKLFPESKSGDFLTSVIKNNPYGDPATWFTQAEQLAKLSALSGEDREAARWALDPANKDKPQAQAIRKQLGI